MTARTTVGFEAEFHGAPARMYEVARDMLGVDLAAWANSMAEERGPRGSKHEGPRVVRSKVLGTDINFSGWTFEADFIVGEIPEAR